MIVAKKLIFAQVSSAFYLPSMLFVKKYQQKQQNRPRPDNFLYVSILCGPALSAFERLWLIALLPAHLAGYVWCEEEDEDCGLGEHQAGVVEGLELLSGNIEPRRMDFEDPVVG